MVSNEKEKKKKKTYLHIHNVGHFHNERLHEKSTHDIYPKH